MGLAQKESARLFCYEDYLSWPEDERWEIINGVAYNMTPAPSLQHLEISRELIISIGTFLKDKPCKLFSAPFDVRFSSQPVFTDTSDNVIFTVVQPDIVVVCDYKKLDKRGCLGAPDLIIEILSRESASRDMKTKLSLYEQNGVKEYWIISPFEQVIWLYNLTEQGNYNRPLIFSDNDLIQSTVLKGLSLNVNDIFSNSIINASTAE